MKERLLRILALVAVLLPVAAHGQETFLPGLENANFFNEKELEVLPSALGVDEEAVVREMYRTVEKNLEASGYKVGFEISGVQTIYPSDFGTVTLESLGTPRGGLYLSISARTMLHPSGGSDRVNFEPSWEEAPTATPNPEKQAFVNMTIEDALSFARAEGEDLPEILAFSVFEVLAKFEGQERVYRANIRWEPADDGTVAFSLQDEIVPDASRILSRAEQISPHRGKKAFEGENIFPHLELDTGTEGATGSCRESDWQQYPIQKSRSGTEDHQPGYRHYAALRVSAACDCKISCIVECDPVLETLQCLDGGPTIGWRNHHAFRDESTQISQGYVQATCGGAIGCAIKRCPPLIGCSVGVAFRFTWNQTAFTVTPLSEVYTNISISASLVCRCHQDEERPEEPGGCEPGVDHSHLGHSH